MYIHDFPERLRNSFTAIQVLRRFKQLESTTLGCYNLSQSCVFFIKILLSQRLGEELAVWVRLKDDAIDSEINEETVYFNIYQTQIQNIMSAFPGARFLQRKIGPFQDPSVGEKEDDVV